MDAPIIVFAYNRVDKLEECIDSLRVADGHWETKVYIYADGAKGAKDSGAVAEVRGYLDGLAAGKAHGFKELHLEYRETNIGIADNVISGVSEVIKRHGKVIVVEDDLVVKRDFLTYMNEALNYYEHESDVWSVTGYSDNLAMPAGYDHDVFYGYRGCSLGWGTWSDRWETVDWEMGRYDEVMHDRHLRKNFERGGRDMTRILKDQKMGIIDSWAIRWCLEESLQGRYTVYPTKSFVVNIGNDGSGTNQPMLPYENRRSRMAVSHGDGNGTSRRMIASLRSRDHIPGVKWQLERLMPDKRVCRIFYKHYSGFWRRVGRNMNLAGIRRQVARMRVAKNV